MFSAALLLSLQTEQLLSLQVPVVVNEDHLQSLSSQTLRSCDRLKVLDNQADAWCDDEFRYHLKCLADSFVDFPIKKGVSNPQDCMVLDPLLATGWLHHGVHECQSWGANHTEVKPKAMIIITACMVEGHWIPLVMQPQGSNLHVHTWDAPHHDHSLVNQICGLC